MVLVIIGIAIIIWAFRAGIGTREFNRAQIFQGPTGGIVNLIVIAVGVILIISGLRG